jgi:glyoxylase I family protein
VARSVTFYTTHLGFTLGHQQLPAFANVSLGDVQILLSGPQASGSRPMPNGQQQEPGGWNRVVLRVNDLPAFIDTLKKAGLHFRNDMEPGPGGKQIQIEHPDGNPIELFEPARSVSSEWCHANYCELTAVCAIKNSTGWYGVIAAAMETAVLAEPPSQCPTKLSTVPRISR